MKPAMLPADATTKCLVRINGLKLLTLTSDDKPKYENTIIQIYNTPHNFFLFTILLIVSYGRTATPYDCRKNKKNPDKARSRMLILI